MLKLVRAGAQPALLRKSMPCLIRCVAPIANKGIKTAAATRSFATIGSEGSDSDFAPKKAAPVATQGRDVASEIKQMVTSRKAMIFMKGTPDFPMCGFSNRAIQILDQHKATYGAFNILEDVEIREGVKKFSNWPTIPQLYINGEFVGGCDIMMELNASGELKKLLTEANAAPAQ
eukprot:CAMPEP_0172192676 /NCGR_PEP_ID=MMETSP1050-20130122/24475_1 /TAXON_ID=233186 /ORGANISM="Cryptomonas curvata, Strain CCAP979/52" /LENGTH=174 /DNA_ID=CAMNT_0012868035 /DNA_START=20 /DNA_END=544 /DNA_ORIENTATION=-